MAKNVRIVLGQEVVVSNLDGDSVRIMAGPDGLSVTAAQGRVVDKTSKVTRQSGSARR